MDGSSEETMTTGSPKKTTTELPLTPSVDLWTTNLTISMSGEKNEELDTEEFIKILSDTSYFWYKRSALFRLALKCAISQLYGNHGLGDPEPLCPACLSRYDAALNDAEDILYERGES